MPYSTAVKYTIVSALAWLIAVGLWLMAFLWWTTGGPDAAVPSAVVGVVGLIPFVISWVLATRFHAASTEVGRDV